MTYATSLARIKRKLVRRFPIGCHVRLSAKAHRAGIAARDAESTGTVVGYAFGVLPKVLWQGRKTASSYAWEFLTRIKTRKNP